MRVRLKYGTRRSVVSISPDESIVGHLLDTVALNLNIDRNDVRVSLNNTNFFGRDEEAMPIAEWGLVAGDLVYVTTNSQEEEPVDQASPTACRILSRESDRLPRRQDISPLPVTLPDACHNLMADLNLQTPLHCLALAVYTVILDEHCFNVQPDESAMPEKLANAGNVVRFSVIHSFQSQQEQVDTVTITLVESGQFASACGQVVFPNGDTSSYTATIPICENVVYDQDAQRFRYVDETNLAIRVQDDLLMKIRQEIHEYYQLPPLGIQRLPVELQLRLLSYLDARSLCRLECSCSVYRNLSRHGKLWQELYARDFPKDYKLIQEAVRNDNTRNWKLTYRQAYEEKRRMELQRRRVINPRTQYGRIIPWSPNILEEETVYGHPRGMIGGPADLHPPFLGPHYW